jgi:hypothetical protein
MNEQTKEQILLSLTQNLPNQNREYVDKVSGRKFNITVPINLSEIIRSLRFSEEFYRKNKNIIVDGKSYEIEKEVLEMCYRCAEYVVSPKLELQDWLYLSIVRGDLVIAINAEISDMIFSSINNLTDNPLAGQIFSSS